jgi:hypothetical protein
MAEHCSLLAEAEEFVRSVLVASAILGVITSGVALAADHDVLAVNVRPFIDDVSNWISKQWNLAKAEWTEEKEKWADCQKHFQGSEFDRTTSWSFLASDVSN